MSALCIIHGGQTGVDRGAWKGARDARCPVSGVMPKDGADEFGAIPREVAVSMTRCPTPGLRARTLANIGFVDALLVVVEDAQDPYATPGTRMTLEEARYRKKELPRRVVDRTFMYEEVATWVSELIRERAAPTAAFSLMVAGPRQSKWRAGEDVAAAFVRAIARVVTSPGQS